MILRDLFWKHGICYVLQHFSVASIAVSKKKQRNKNYNNTHFHNSLYQKAQDVRVEKQSLEVELATLKEKFERESERRQAALKDYKELELQMTETKTQLKVRDSQNKQTDEENRTLNQVKMIFSLRFF